jgi:hypothetical protein
MQNQAHIAALGISLLLPLSLSAQVTSFSGTGTGTIPDAAGTGPGAWGQPLDVSFAVSGLTAPIADLSVSMTMRYAYLGDLDVTLIPPTGSGANPFVLFSQVGQPALTFGSPLTVSSDTSGNNTGTYTFNDHATGDIWIGFDKATGNSDYSSLSNLPDTTSYRTTVSGPWDATTNPNAGQFTSFAHDSGFVGLSPTQADGLWTLQIRIGATGENPGIVTDATLDITAVPEPSRSAVLAGLGLTGFTLLRLAGKRNASA